MASSCVWRYLQRSNPQEQVPLYSSPEPMSLLQQKPHESSQAGRFVRQARTVRERYWPKPMTLECCIRLEQPKKHCNILQVAETCWNAFILMNRFNGHLATSGWKGCHLQGWKFQSQSACPGIRHWTDQIQVLKWLTDAHFWLLSFGLQRCKAMPILML